MKHQLIIMAGFAGMLLAVIGCKARKVDTEILQSATHTSLTGEKQAHSLTATNQAVKQQIIVQNQSNSSEQTIIYPTHGLPFTYSNGTFTGQADSIKGKRNGKNITNSTTNTEQNTVKTAKVDSSLQYKQVTDQSTLKKTKHTDAKPVLNGTLLWIFCIAAAGFILWSAWQWIKPKV